MVDIMKSNLCMNADSEAAWGEDVKRPSAALEPEIPTDHFDFCKKNKSVSIFAPQARQITL